MCNFLVIKSFMSGKPGNDRGNVGRKSHRPAKAAGSDSLGMLDFCLKCC